MYDATERSQLSKGQNISCVQILFPLFTTYMTEARYLNPLKISFLFLKRWTYFWEMAIAKTEEQIIVGLIEFGKQ
jgi:succinate-acetate transporter protein